MVHMLADYFQCIGPLVILENSSPSIISSNVISQLPLSEAPIGHVLGLLALNCYFICPIFISLGDFPSFISHLVIL